MTASAARFARAGWVASCAMLVCLPCQGQEEAEKAGAAEKAEVVEAAAEREEEVPDQAPSLTAEKVPDYSKGLELLAGLGMPEMEGAEWVEVKRGNYVESPLSSYGYQLRELGIELKGVGWRLASGQFLAAGAASEAPLPDGVKKSSQLGESEGVGAVLSTMLKNFKQEHPDKVEEAPDPSVLIERDLKLVISGLRRPESRSEIRNSMQYGGFRAGGPLLLLAAQAHAAGHEDLANRIVHELFTATGQRSQLLDEAVAAIADARYNELASAFFENHDWKAYYEGLTQLQEDFARGWVGRYAIAMLAPQVKQRADKLAAPVPTLDGIKLPAKGVELAQSLCEPPPETRPEDIDLPEGVVLEHMPAEQRAMILAHYSGASSWQQGGHPWVLQSNPESASENPILAIKASGMDGVIILAALIGDETLTPQSSHNGYNQSRSMSYGYSQSLSEKIKSYQQGMNRPLTRGEIAEALLRTVVPSGDINSDPYGYGSSQMEPAILRELAIEFWKKHRKASSSELHAMYLKHGDAAQKLHTATKLATTDDEELIAVFEKGVLTMDNLLGMMQPVSTYLEHRKVKAKGFYEAYASKMRDLYGAMSKEELQQLPDGWQLSNEGVEGHLKRLGVHVGSASVREIVNDALKPETRDQAHWAEFSQTLSQLPISEVVVAIAEVRDRTTPEDRAWLLGSLMNWGSGEERAPFDDKALKAWRALLKDERPVGESQYSYWLAGMGIEQTRELAGLILEVNSEEEFFSDLQMHHAATGDSVGPILIERAIARIDGGEIPPLINADGLDEERRNEIAKLASEARDVMDLKSSLDKLSPPERVAWLEWYQNMAQGMVADLEEIPEALLSSRNTIVEVDESASKMAAKLDLELGSKVEADKFEGLAKTLLESLGEDSSLALATTPTRMGLGLKLQITQPAGEDQLKATAEDWQLREVDPNASTYVVLAFGYRGQALIWQAIEGELKLLGDQPLDEMPMIQEYQSYIESEELWPAPLNITILSREDYLKHLEDH